LEYRSIGKGKGKVHPTRGHENPEGKYSTSVLGKS